MVCCQVIDFMVKSKGMLKQVKMDNRLVVVCSVAVSVTHSCPTLWEPMDCSPQAPMSMGFFRQKYWSELPCPPPGDLSDRGIESQSPGL